MYIETLDGIVSEFLKVWRSERSKNHSVSGRLRFPITAVLKAKRESPCALLFDISPIRLPRIKSVIAGFAKSFSKRDIQRLLQGAQTTLTLRFISGAVRSFRGVPSSASCRRVILDIGNSLFIQSLQMCSPVSFAVDGQNAHSFAMPGILLPDFLASQILADPSSASKRRPLACGGAASLCAVRKGCVAKPQTRTSSPVRFATTPSSSTTPLEFVTHRIDMLRQGIGNLTEKYIDCTPGVFIEKPKS